MTRLYHESFPIAELIEDSGLSLSYDETWLARPSAFPISVTMPLGSDRYGADLLLPWLANLLPEAHLSEIGQQLKIAPQDVLGLLRHIGRDTAGAISVGIPRAPGTHAVPIPGKEALEKIIDELPEKPFLVGERGVSMSLAGVQEKLPVHIDANGGMGIPTDGTPSTHIIKPDAKRLPASVQNEAFCMTLARRCGLDAAEVITGKAGTRTYLLVKRYDRTRDGNGVMRRIHQEDFCQVLGYFPSRKYERARFGERNGPGLVQMFKAIETHVSPGERIKFLDAVIFNVLICNTDAHAKNYSILVGQQGSARLAPLYDLMCAAVYPNVDSMLAQSVNGRTDGAHIHGADWRQLAKDAGLSPAQTVRRVAQLAEAVAGQADAAAEAVASMPAGGSELLLNIAHEVKKRARRMERQLRH